jgi:hypothetical protein
MLFIPVVSLSPFAIAKIQEGSGSYTPAFLGLGAIVLLSSALSLMLRQRRGGYPTTAENEVSADAAVAPMI